MDRISRGVYAFVSIITIGWLGIVLYSTSTTSDNVDKLIDRSNPRVKEYEDHSARITVGDVICVVPAFDSPEDKIVCE